RDQHRLSRQAVTEMAKKQSAERPGQETDREGRECCQRAYGWVIFWEEQLAKHQSGRGAIDEEVVPVQRRSDSRCNYDVFDRSGGSDLPGLRHDPSFRSSAGSDYCSLGGQTFPEWPGQCQPCSPFLLKSRRCFG